ncbi:Uncharacterized protein YydD, contains DUF2326 domain [Hydrogenimonas thermophila]|uniref:Uncharacterized protein YydD, contains DUF2326 domain n=2 Tax=Hydrogenimonas thermophila TaxID=223786 RepID=A0A1I5TDL3_9BACT|nr:Uncharacterized protein YydD, contains DUF2326 domain [Hydrogenimonas thermophila]
MFLKRLEIVDNTLQKRRVVDFNESGLNLIVGIGDQNKTTNDIGKTTLIRVLDFCFDGKIEQLYTDKEFKESINEDIYDFLKTKQPVFKLFLEDRSTGFNYEIKRVVTYKKDRLKVENQILFNGQKREGDFNAELKKILFNNISKKPSLRQLIPKFIRKDENQINNVLKYLHPATSNSEYEKIHLFLFGFKAKKLLQEKSELERELKRNKKDKSILGKRFNIIDLKQILEIINKDLEELYKQRDEFQLDEKYELEEEQLKNIQLKLIEIEKIITNLNLQKSLTKKQLEELEKDRFLQDTQLIKLLYDEAKFYIDKLHKSFDEVVTFHNKMIENEKIYMKNRLDNIEENLLDLTKQRGGLQKEYSNLMKKLSKTGSLAEFTKLNEQIEKLAEQKGQNEKLLEELEKIEINIKHTEERLSKIKDEINTNLEDFNNKLSLFNKYFSKYSKILYDVEFFISYDLEEDPIKFYIKNAGGNEGSGKKQAIITAFDLAYIDFINELHINFPHFVAHDKVELIDINKLEKLFEIANNISGQFIVPIIYDKIESIYDKYKGNVILELSEENKFFGV